MCMRELARAAQLSGDACNAALGRDLFQSLTEWALRLNVFAVGVEGALFDDPVNLGGFGKCFRKTGAHRIKHELRGAQEVCD